MRINEITLGTSFVRMIRNDDETTFFVDEKIEHGVRTLITTTDPLRARLYTLKEAVEFIHDRLTDDQKKDLLEVYSKKNGYSWESFFVKYFRDRFASLGIDRLDYGASDDLVSEAKLLHAVDLGYLCDASLVTEQTIDQ